jgi:formylglycine-generating enzyme required for sulfatase activity
VVLKSATADAARPEIVIAAWEQLGEKRISPDWPANTEELAKEAELRAKVSEALGTLSEAERKPLDELLDREGPRRWRRFVESATDEKMLAAAIEKRKAFDINHVVLADMSPEARFNVWLYLANLAIRDNNDAGLDSVIQNLKLAARGLEDRRKEAAQVLDKLARLKAPETFADKNLGDRFELSVRGVDMPIEFRRVEPKDGSRPFYLGTREVTLGQFASVLDGNNLWPEARKLAWPSRPGKGDGRPGARVWEWVDVASASPRIGPTSLWMYADDVDRHNDFPSEFHPEAKFNRNVIGAKLGGMPSDRHPMQYVSAQAALYYATALGCRLPSSAEWRNALDSSGGSTQKGDWNLRDETWEKFRAHATKQQIAVEHWPDRGAFPGEAPAAIPPSRPGNDGTFLFRAATSNDGVFRDLVGNVAEYVCEVPDAFARWTDKKTADDMKRFLSDTPDAVAVIGGSALSPADVAVDKALPVSRPDRGYSDVGLRLAFTAPARNLAERLKWVLAGEDYAWPRTVSADTSGTR